MWLLRLFLGTCLALFIGIYAGGQSIAANTLQWRGYLVDRSCRASIDGDEHPLRFIRAQTRECALLPSCRKAGYSLYSKGKWLNLDKNGNKLAEKYLVTSKKSKAFYVLVEGSLDGTTINAISLTELDEPSTVEK